MDTTAIGIAIGIVGVAIFATILAIRQRTFNVANSVLVFLAFFAVSVGADLLRAAFLGNEKNLPKSWREYIAVAAVVGIGLSLNFLVRTLRSAWTRPLAATEDRDSNSDTSSR